ncbi:MAG: hypothetical protein J6A16_12205 [Oscillospiraceae bacterium]|nr:hypothetical protein [Oscillospiraceae bacterium]
MNYTVKDIERLALDNSRLDGITFPPEDMPELEKVLYWQLYNLCRLFAAGAVDKNYAKVLKNRYITEYGRADLKRDIYGQAHRRRVHINVALQKGIDDGCEHCRRVLDLLDGKLDSRIVDTEDVT